MDNQVSGENLAVMGVTTKVKVNTGSCCLVQFFWLMVNENNWFSLVQRFGKLGRSGSGALHFFASGGILAADNIKFVVDQNSFIV